MSAALSRAVVAGRPDAAAGIVLAHEGFGLTGFVRARAEALAAHGLHVVAPALYHRHDQLVYGYDEAEAATLQATSLDLAGALADLGTAWEWAGQDGHRPVGLVGWCLGAGLAVAAATLPLPFATVIAYYPVRVAQYAPTGAPHRPLVVHIGDADEFASPEDWRRLDDLASRPGVTVHRYRHARHGFANPDRTERFSPDAAADADARTLAALLAAVSPKEP